MVLYLISINRDHRLLLAKGYRRDTGDEMNRLLTFLVSVFPPISSPAIFLLLEFVLLSESKYSVWKYSNFIFSFTQGNYIKKGNNNKL